VIPVVAVVVLALAAVISVVVQKSPTGGDSATSTIERTPGGNTTTLQTTSTLSQNADGDFVALLQQGRTLRVEDVNSAVAAGKGVCTQLKQRADFDTVAAGLDQRYVGVRDPASSPTYWLSNDDISRFIRAAVQIYCSEQTTALPSTG
jgi:hypothetical protein